MLPERVQRKIMPSSNGCWIWIGGCISNGYGHVKIDGKTLKAHRYVYEALRQKIPAGLCACHTCDVRACVNPDHIFIGTAKQNGEDKAIKGRAAKGLTNGNSKLSEDMVLKIREDIGPIRALAKKYGLAHSTIRVIQARRIWRHL